MRVLVLGGTVFVGRHVVDAALLAGHEVTILHRGTHPAPRPDAVEELLADRDGGLRVLDGREFDTVVDTCGYLPRHVREAAEALVGQVGHYTFVSSANAYPDRPLRVPVREGDPEQVPLGEDVTEVTDLTYGPLKVACERAVQAALPGRVLIQRAGIIVGTHDPTDRFTYWARRLLNQPGPVLVPDVPDQPVQVIDVRDLAAWTVTAAVAGVTGVFNAVRPEGSLTFAGLVAAAAGLVAHPPEPVWVAERFLLDHGISPWSQIPLWVNSADEPPGLMMLDSTRAERAGLTFRAIAQTLEDTAAWDVERPHPSPGALTPEREAQLLADWHSSR